MSRQSDLCLPCKGLPRFLVASSGVGPIKVALFHLHGNSCYCRQETPLGTNKKTNCLQGFFPASPLSVYLQVLSKAAPAFPDFSLSVCSTSHN